MMVSLLVYAQQNRIVSVFVQHIVFSFAGNAVSALDQTDSALAAVPLPDVPRCSRDLQPNPLYVIPLFLFSFPSVCRSRVS